MNKRTSEQCTPRLPPKPSIRTLISIHSPYETRASRIHSNCRRFTKIITIIHRFVNLSFHFHQTSVKITRHHFFFVGQLSRIVFREPRTTNFGFWFPSNTRLLRSNYASLCFIFDICSVFLLLISFHLLISVILRTFIQQLIVNIGMQEQRRMYDK